MNSSDNEQTELLRAIWNEMKALGTNLGGRIDQTNTRLGAVVETVDRRFAETNGRLDHLSTRVDETNSRLGVVEEVLRDLAAQQRILAG